MPTNLSPILHHSGAEIEEIEDVDAPKAANHSWNGEETFWMCEDDLETQDGGGWEAEDEDHSWLVVNDEQEEEVAFNAQSGKYVFPPSLDDASAAFKDITNILKPPRKKGHGYKDAGLDAVTWT